MASSCEEIEEMKKIIRTGGNISEKKIYFVIFGDYNGVGFGTVFCMCKK